MKTPKLVPGLLMWLDASDQATVNNGRVTNNENVYKFVDKVSGVTLVNNNGVNGPTYKYSTIKGRNIIEFASYNTTTFNDISLKSLTASNFLPNFWNKNFATFSMFCVYLPTTQVGTESNIISMWNSGRVDGVNGLSEGGFPNRGIGLSNTNGAGRYIEALAYLANFPYHNEYQGFSENVHVYSGEQPSSFGKVSVTSVRLQKNLKKIGFLSENSSSLEDTTLAIDSLNNPNVVIIAEDFNTGTLNSLRWDQVQSGGTGWGLVSAPYNDAGNFTNFSVSTPSSNFVILNSASGSSVGNTSLISPTFSTLGRSDITVNFRHVFRYKIGDIARLDYTVDGGTIWTSTTYSITATSPSQTWNPAAVQVENVSVSLGSGASGKSGVRVRFFYTYNNSFYWAIDNFSVSGVENLLGTPRNGGSVGYYSDRFPGPVSNGYAVPPQLPTINGGTNKGFKSRWNINSVNVNNYFVLGGFWPKSASFGKSQTAPFQGQFCEFLMFDRFLSDSETNSIRLYLQNKWFPKSPTPDPTPPTLGPLSSPTPITSSTGSTMDGELTFTFLVTNGVGLFYGVEYSQNSTFTPVESSSESVSLVAATPETVTIKGYGDFGERRWYRGYIRNADSSVKVYTTTRDIQLEDIKFVSFVYNVGIDSFVATIQFNATSGRTISQIGIATKRGVGQDPAISLIGFNQTTIASSILITNTYTFNIPASTLYPLGSGSPILSGESISGRVWLVVEGVRQFSFHLRSATKT